MMDKKANKKASQIAVCCYLITMSAWKTTFWTKSFTEVDLVDIWEEETTAFVGV